MANESAAEAVNKWLREAGDEPMNFTPMQQVIINDTRFIGLNLACFFKTCTENGIPQPLTEGMTYMLMTRFMNMHASVQGYTAHVGPPGAG